MNQFLKDYLFLFLPINSNWGTQVNALMGNTLNKSENTKPKHPSSSTRRTKSHSRSSQYFI